MKKNPLAFFHINFIITDWNMPNMNGLELVTRMKEDEMLNSIPVVMVTTEGSEQKVQQSMALGASGYIKKPFMPEDIKTTLNGIMGEPEDGETIYDEDNEGCDF